MPFQDKFPDSLWYEKYYNPRKKETASVNTDPKNGSETAKTNNSNVDIFRPFKGFLICSLYWPLHVYCKALFRTWVVGTKFIVERYWKRVLKLKDLGDTANVAPKKIGIEFNIETPLPTAEEKLFTVKFININDQNQPHRLNKDMEVFYGLKKSDPQKYFVDAVAKFKDNYTIKLKENFDKALCDAIQKKTTEIICTCNAQIAISEGSPRWEDKLQQVVIFFDRVLKKIFRGKCDCKPKEFPFCANTNLNLNGAMKLVNFKMEKLPILNEKSCTIVFENKTDVPEKGMEFFCDVKRKEYYITAVGAVEDNYTIHLKQPFDEALCIAVQKKKLEIICKCNAQKAIPKNRKSPVSFREHVSNFFSDVLDRVRDLFRRKCHCKPNAFPFCVNMNLNLNGAMKLVNFKMEKLPVLNEKSCTIVFENKTDIPQKNMEIFCDRLAKIESDPKYYIGTVDSVEYNYTINLNLPFDEALREAIQKKISEIGIPNKFPFLASTKLINGETQLVSFKLVNFKTNNKKSCTVVFKNESAPRTGMEIFCNLIKQDDQKIFVDSVYDKYTIGLQQPLSFVKTLRQAIKEKQPMSFLDRVEGVFGCLGKPTQFPFRANTKSNGAEKSSSYFKMEKLPALNEKSCTIVFENKTDTPGIRMEVFCDLEKKPTQRYFVDAVEGIHTINLQQPFNEALLEGIKNKLKESTCNCKFSADPPVYMNTVNIKTENNKCKCTKLNEFPFLAITDEPNTNQNAWRKIVLPALYNLANTLKVSLSALLFFVVTILTGPFVLISFFLMLVFGPLIRFVCFLVVFYLHMIFFLVILHLHLPLFSVLGRKITISFNKFSLRLFRFATVTDTNGLSGFQEWFKEEKVEHPLFYIENDVALAALLGVSLIVNVITEDLPLVFIQMTNNIKLSQFNGFAIFSFVFSSTMIIRVIFLTIWNLLYFQKEHNKKLEKYNMSKSSNSRENDYHAAHSYLVYVKDVNDRNKVHQSHSLRDLCEDFCGPALCSGKNTTLDYETSGETEKCGRCPEKNKPGAKFCRYCGNKSIAPVKPQVYPAHMQKPKSTKNLQLTYEINDELPAYEDVN